MVMAIISAALELILLCLATNPFLLINRGFAIFVMVMFVICTITSFITLFVNISYIKKRYARGRGITGLVFSIVGLVTGLIFCISVFGTMAALTHLMEGFIHSPS